MTTHRALPLVLLISSLLLQIIAGCDAGESSTTAPVSFAVSDAPIGQLAAVVITVDQITLNQPGDDIVIDMFPNDDPNEADTETITVDLLDVQGLDNKLIVNGIELRVGEYQNLRLSIVDNDIDLTYVEETGGARKPIKAPSGVLNRLLAKRFSG